MMADVSIRLEPPVGFIMRQSGAFRRALENLVPLWERFERTLVSIEQERFDTRGYGDWPALAASTLAQKAAHGFPLDPLVRTGALRDSLTSFGHDQSASQKGPQQFVWGTSVPYAQYHQEDGTPRMPQRKVLEIRTEDRRRLESDQVTWLNEQVRLTWGRV